MARKAGADRQPGPEVVARARRIKLILFDVDGVLTDGTLLLHADGSESKRFDIKDGTGIVLAQRAGIRVGFLSARLSAATQQRAAQLGVTLVHQGIASKLETYEQIADELLLDGDDIAYMGDDVVDLAVMTRVGLAAAPDDGTAEARARAHWVSDRRGGAGAARQLVELILQAQGLWEPLVREYLSQKAADSPPGRVGAVGR